MYDSRLNVGFRSRRWVRPDSIATFGVSGILRDRALVMYDRRSTSLWTQRGLAIAGPLRGLRLRQLPSERAAWAHWQQRHPHTLVMVSPIGTRLRPAEDAED